MAQPKTLSELINLLIERNFCVEIYKRFQADADRINSINKNAAIWRNPKDVLRFDITHYLGQIRGVNTSRSDNQFVDRLVGLSAEFMPSLLLYNLIERITFGGIQVKVNDILDDYHVCYLPYCDLMLLDKNTYNRVKQTKLAQCSKIFSNVINFSKSWGEK
ncbi:MAG: hypothetical protein ABIL69_03520 [candidate division WOR-3 bacterium]